MNYSKAIQTIRESRKLTQKELADFASVTPGYISKIEKGERVPTLEVIEKICEKSGIPFALFALIASSSDHFDTDTISDINVIQSSLIGLLQDDYRATAH